MSNVDNNRSQAINQLFRGILTLQDIDECYRFFGDLFTVQELTAFAQRFQVAELLAKGCTYDGVREKVPTSYSTITRINTELTQALTAAAFITARSLATAALPSPSVTT